MKKQRREWLIILVNSLAYVALVVSFFAMLKYKNHLVQTCVFAIYTCTMTGLLTYSMLKLRKFSRLLAADGILASKRLLTLHVACFWIVSILEIASSIVTFMLAYKLDDEKSKLKRETNNLALA